MLGDKEHTDLKKLIKYVREYDDDKYDNFFNIFKKWVIPVEISKIEKLNIYDIYNNHCKNNNRFPHIFKYVDDFLDKLMPYAEAFGISKDCNNLRDKTSIASSVLLYYGSLFYKFHFDSPNSSLDDLHDYTILYILMDQYIDDINLNDSIKDIAIIQMTILINDPHKYKDLKLIDPILKHMTQIYIKLIDKYPNIKQSIINIFMAQIKGHKKQKNKTLEREDYYKVASDKGGYTIQVLTHFFMITGEKNIKDSYDMGVIVQLIDDCADVKEDRINNIYTTSLYDLDKKGFLDDIFIDIVVKISDLDNKYNVIKILLTYNLLLVVSKNPICYSSRLKQLIEPYNLFKYINDEVGLKYLSEYILKYMQDKLNK
jgi:hypothetical protein